MNRGSANPINQNILKLGPLLDPGAVLTLLFFDFTLLINSLAGSERSDLKSFRGKGAGCEGGLREPRFRVRAAGL